MKIKSNKNHLLDVEDLTNSLPEIAKIVKGGHSKTLKSLVKAKKTKELDTICSCVKIGLNHLNEKNFGNEDFQNLRKSKELLRFLSDFAQCSENKKKCLVHERNRKSVQAGQGISIILKSLLPLLLSEITKSIKNKKSKS